MKVEPKFDHRAAAAAGDAAHCESADALPFGTHLAGLAEHYHFRFALVLVPVRPLEPMVILVLAPGLDQYSSTATELHRPKVAEASHCSFQPGIAR